MSDSDSDWPTSEEDEPVASSGVSIVDVSAKKHSSKHNDAHDHDDDDDKDDGQGNKKDAEEEKTVPPKVVLYIPVQTMLYGTTQGTVAGATIIHDSEKQYYSVSFLDAQKRAFIHDIVSYAKPSTAGGKDDGNDGKSPSGVSSPISGSGSSNSILWDDVIVPFTVSFDVQDGNAHLLPLVKYQDGKKRRWKVQFMNMNDTFRFLSVCMLIEHIASKSKGKANKTLQMKDCNVGTGKKLKPKSYAKVSVKTWTLPCTPTPTNSDTLSQFQLQLDTMPASIAEDVKVNEMISGLPSLLGQLLYKSRVGISKLAFIPSFLSLVNDLREYGVDVESSGDLMGEGVFVFLTVTDVSKKRKKKEKKKIKKSKSNSQTPPQQEQQQEASQAPTQPETVTEEEKVDSTQPPPPQQQQQQQEHKEQQQQEEAEEEDASGDDAVASIQEQLTDTLTALKALNQTVKAMPTTQVKIIKHLLSVMYGSTRGKLGLDEEGADAKSVSLSSVDEVVRDAMVNVVPGYTEANTNADYNGTVATVSAQTSTALDAYSQLAQNAALQAFLKGDYVRGGSNQQQQQQQQEQQQINQLSRELEAEKKKAQKLKLENSKLGRKQVELATLNIEMEEQITALQKDKKQTEAKLSEMVIFEEGMQQMRKMLDAEIETKTQVQQELDDLTTVTKSTKMVWVPKNAIDYCILCGSKFKMWGAKSKHYCRYCGRVYCRDCSDFFVELPELGLKDKARTCRACYRIKTGGDEEGKE